MEKHTQEQIIQQQQQPLKCPRCDSSNTKFCYYNNYNLSQPRHFCKACKRYWTRGGTLRNVPVGGGCRKNKRLKKAVATTKALHSSSPSTRMTTTTTTTNPSGNHSRTDHIINPLLYGLYSSNSSSDLDFSFQRFNSRVDASPVYEYNLQQKLLGFSSSSTSPMATDITTSSAFLTNYITSSPIIGSSNSSVSPSSNSTMASLMTASSNLEPEKPISPHSNFFGMIPASYSDMQTEEFNKLHQMEASPDANSIFSVGASWFDPAHFGSSVPSLI